MDVTLDIQRNRQPHMPAITSDLDLGQLERIEDQLDPATGESWIDLVGVAVQPDRAGPRHRPVFAPAERFAQRTLGRDRRRAGGEEPIQWRLPGLGMRTPVIDRLDPALKQAAELLDA